MIAYHPLKKTSIRKQVLLLLALGFISGLVVISGLKRSLYANQSKQIIPTETAVLSPYSQKIQQETNVAKLARTGNNLLKKQMPLYAALNLKRASDLDANYRDVAYGWAFAVLQAKSGALSPSDIAEIKTALERVDSVDPHYLPALRLKKMIAEIEGDGQTTQLISRRIELLEK